ncbi:MAG: interleukin-like EMT inducer domain-containing protein [Nitrososphaerales archaeon]
MLRYLRVLFAYTVLALVLTWSMAARFATHVPGDGIDDPSLAWNLWWVKHALIDQPQNPFAVAWQFWPIGINLAFYTLTVLNGMLAAPFVAVFGVIPAYNVQLLLSFVLSGLGGYLLARQFLGRAGNRRRAAVAAFVAGALYAFASSKLFYAALGQGNVASSQWVPFAALYVWRAAGAGGRVRDAVLAGVFLILQAYAELTYASFLPVFAALCILWGGANRLQGGWRGLLPLVGRFAVIGAVFAAGIAPILANMIPDLAAEGDFFTSGGGFADVFSADLAGYLVPTQLHPVLGGIVRAWSHNSTPQPDGAYFAVDKGQQIYVGYVALALALLGFWRGRRRSDTWLWGISAAVFFLLTLGPNLRIAGHDTGIPLPFRLMQALPFFKGNRYPSRYAVMLLISLAPLVAAGVLAVLSGVKDRKRAGRLDEARTAGRLAALAPALLLALMLFEHLSVPLPSSDLRVPALYERLVQEPGDFALLELPPGWRNGARVAGKQDVVIMQELWNQTLHGKRVLGGNTSRNPEYKFQYFSEQPTLSRLIAQTNAADLPQHDALAAELSRDAITEADREEARRWATFTAIRYVMVHRDKLPATTEAAAKDLLPLTLVAEEGPLALHRVNPALVGAAPTSFRLGSDADRIVLGEGWSSVAPGSTGVDAEDNPLGLFAQRPEARLLLPLGPGASTLRINAGALVPEQRVTLIVDGQEVGSAALAMQPGWLEFPIAPAANRPPLSNVQLRFDRTIGVDELGKRLSRAGPAALLVRSAGQETGDFAHIYLNGREMSPNRRGYNLVALDAAGRFLRAASFDTNADPEASQQLAEWVAGLEPGTVVAGAVRDEASAKLGQEAVDALASLGVATDLRGHFRWGHAFIGQVAGQTAERGGQGWAQTAEASDGVRPVQLSFGFPLSEPNLAAQVFEVQIVK